ncbi:MAG: c-type cytochrome biogenesis protein CcmI [Betaproteobacteria bacterium]|nr:MAG: c-type cytochrome biogenesis protein CcmI [Betaproteobacteria bacterium]
MSSFVVAAAVLTLVTLALLMLPLLRKRVAPPRATQSDASVAVLRDQLEELERDRASGAISAEAYEAAHRGLKLRILEDAVPEAAASDRPHAVPAIALAVLMPLAAAGLYAWLGTPQLLDPQPGPVQAGAKHIEAGQMEAAVEKLAQRLQSTPDDLEGWTMLARSYRVLGRHADAVAAFARAEKKIASDPQRLTEWAESIALTSGGTLSGRPTELIARALAVDPDYGHALALAGAAAFERKDWRGAITHWERLAQQFPPGTDEGDTIGRSLAAAREELGKAGGAPAKPAAAAAAVTAPKPPAAAIVETGKAAPKFRLTGTVSLAPALSAKASPEDVVFIFARAAAGPPMPLAVVRKTVKELPAEFAFDESSAMMADAKLAAIGEVIVGARISRSGVANPQSGDLQGLSRPVKIGATGVKVVIDSALP